MNAFAAVGHRFMWIALLASWLPACGADTGSEDTAPDAQSSSADSGSTGAGNASSSTTGPGSGTGAGSTTGSGGATGSGGGSSSGISASYPGDVGIEAHPSVVFFEDFEEADVGSMASRWDSADQDPLALVGDVPPGAAGGSHSLEITVPSGAGVTGVTLFKNVPDQQGSVYVRYYAKYDAASDYHHAGMWLGGFNPPTKWPQGTAGIRPSGSDFFENAWEPHSTGSELQVDHYAQWPGMDCFMEPGGCWGNVFLRDAEPTVSAASWVCVELMVRLNTPGQNDGEYAVWMNDGVVQHLAPGSPSFDRLGNGVWKPNPAGTPFPGFDWRSTTDLAFNWIWLDFYVDSGPSSMRWDQIVVATERIGCMTAAP